MHKGGIMKKYLFGVIAALSIALVGGAGIETAACEEVSIDFDDSESEDDMYLLEYTDEVSDADSDYSDESDTADETDDDNYDENEDEDTEYDNEDYDLENGKKQIPLEGIAISGNAVTVEGKSTKYKAIFTPSNTTGKSVIWSVSPENHGVTITNTGLLKAAKGCGLKECVVTVKSKNSNTIFASKKVGINPASVKSISITSGGTSIVGKTIKLFRLTGNSNAKTYIDTLPGATLAGGMQYNAIPFEYISKNKDIVTVDENGRVSATGIKTGKAQIVCRAIDGTKDENGNTYSKSYWINVVNPVSGIDLSVPSGRSKYVANGKTLQLNSTVSEAFGKVSSKGLNYKSSDTSVATVNSKGVVTMKSDYYSPVTITATAADGSGMTGSINLIAACPTKNISLGDISYANANRGYTLLDLSEGKVELPVIFNEPEGAGASIKKVSPDLQVKSSQSDCLDVIYKNGVVTLVPKKVYDKKNIAITVNAMDGTGYTVSWNFRVK